MQVILQEKIKNLGTIGEIVDVKPGYARNFLFRSGKALPANKANVEQVMARKSELEKIELERRAQAVKRVKHIEAIGVIEMSVPTNEEGKLFGSVGASEIVDHFLTLGHEVSKQEVSIVEVPVRSVGEYTVVVQAHADVAAQIKLKLLSSTATELEIVSVSETDDAQSDAAAEVESESN